MHMIGWLMQNQKCQSKSTWNFNMNVVESNFNRCNFIKQNDLLGFTKTISAGHAYITKVCVFDVPPHLEGPSDWNLTNLKHGWFLLKMTSMVRIPWDPVFCPYIFGKIMRLKLSFGKSYKSWYCGKTNNKASPSHHQKWVVQTIPKW